MFNKNKNTLSLRNKLIKPNKFAFSSNLESVVFKSSVKVIGEVAFIGCRKLKEVIFNNGLVEIQARAFTNCTALTEVTLPKSLVKLGEDAFKNCSNLKTITLPDNLEVLPKSAFENCTALERIVLPAKITTIEEDCFSGCINLKEIVFNNNLLKIDNKAFNRCQSLTYIDFPQSLKHIGNKVFSGCTNINRIKINSNLDYLGKRPFSPEICEKITVSGTAFCSSFLTKSDAEKCTSITINKELNFLSLGFEGLLSYKQTEKGKTCFRHILSLEKYSAKVFIGEFFYSYSDDHDFLIKDGVFDFQKYDNQFVKATDSEKVIIAAFRLAYPQSLSEAHKKTYEDVVKHQYRDAAVFATEINEEKILAFLFETIDFDTDFCTILYNSASQKGYQNLQELISTKKRKTCISETENLLRSIYEY